MQRKLTFKRNELKQLEMLNVLKGKATPNVTRRVDLFSIHPLSSPLRR
jgi:hypothetical protein